MTTLTPHRAGEHVVRLRRGLDLDDLANPAGTLFSHRYSEHEITMTGHPPWTHLTNQTGHIGEVCGFCCST